jgi:hypothetical protein
MGKSEAGQRRGHSRFSSAVIIRVGPSQRDDLPDGTDAEPKGISAINYDHHSAYAISLFSRVRQVGVGERCSTSSSQLKRLQVGPFTAPVRNRRHPEGD